MKAMAVCRDPTARRQGSACPGRRSSPRFVPYESTRIVFAGAQLHSAMLMYTSAGGSTWEILRALCGAMPVPQASGLAHFDEIAVRVSHVAADFRAPVDRRRHELCPFCLPLLVAGVDVGEDRKSVV